MFAFNRSPGGPRGQDLSILLALLTASYWCFLQGPDCEQLHRCPGHPHSFSGRCRETLPFCLHRQNGHCSGHRAITDFSRADQDQRRFAEVVRHLVENGYGLMSWDQPRAAESRRLLAIEQGRQPAIGLNAPALPTQAARAPTTPGKGASGRSETGLRATANNGRSVAQPKGAGCAAQSYRSALGSAAVTAGVHTSRTPQTLTERGAWGPQRPDEPFECINCAYGASKQVRQLK